MKPYVIPVLILFYEVVSLIALMFFIYSLLLVPCDHEIAYSHV